MGEIIECFITIKSRDNVYKLSIAMAFVTVLSSILCKQLKTVPNNRCKHKNKMNTANRNRQADILNLIRNINP